MEERLIKPYEISIWGEKLVVNEDISYYKEIKIATIGSDKMTGLNKVEDPVFIKKSNGEKTLSFSLRYKYFDPYIEQEVINPFVDLLINERKVKLKYKDEWYDFVIKERIETDNENLWQYNLVDAFVLELSKNGYNIEFDTELNNNQGTARELAEKTVENTDWTVADVNIGKQSIREPIYNAFINEPIAVLNVDTKEEETISGDILVFYSYVMNGNGKFVQFIKKREDNNYLLDDDLCIIATNYRIIDELVYENNKFIKDDTVIITVGALEESYQAYRMVYGQLTTYDPVMERVVERYTIEDNEIYKYTDYEYTTSNVITNFITNGDNFNIYEDGTLQGWSNHTPNTNNTQTIDLITYPQIKSDSALVKLQNLSQVEGYLKIHFDGSLNNNKNTIFNEGIINNQVNLRSISMGDKFVFRWRAGAGAIENLSSNSQLRLMIAAYDSEMKDKDGYYLNTPDLDNIVLQFEGTPQVQDNIINNGQIVFGATEDQYIVDGVVQTISTRYVYKSFDDLDSDPGYIWNSSTRRFIQATANNHLQYYYLIGSAERAITNKILKDSSTKYGIFIYTIGAAGDYYVQDIQLTRYVPDANEEPILIGNVPTATSIARDYYYLKPASDVDATDINTYTTLEGLAIDYNFDIDDIKPLYNEDSEKILSISVSQSNCFNILQTIAETFECWIDLKVIHDDNGALTLSKEGKPYKYIYLNEYAGKDNFAGFKYAVNIDSIERNITSEEIVTKLIVNLAQCDYTDSGYVSIQDANSNPSGESYILNFDYYLNQGLIEDKEQCLTDLYSFNRQLKSYNVTLHQLEVERSDLELSLAALGSKRNVFTELINEAKKTVDEKLDEFQKITGYTYEEYQQNHTVLEFNDRLTEEDTVVEIIGALYTNSSVINNYSGILSNIENEYWILRQQLEGTETYTITVSVVFDSLGERHVKINLSDYVPGFQFSLGGEVYESTVSKKNFDITTSARNLRFIAWPPGYTCDSSLHVISDDIVLKYKITPVNEEKEGLNEQIKDILAEKNALIKNFYAKYSRFIQEGTWNSTEYINSELYYLDALQVSKTSAEPAVDYTIQVVEISELEGYEGYSFDAGEKTFIEDVDFFGWNIIDGVKTPVKKEVIISEVELHLEQPENNQITVQNYKTRFEDLFQSMNAAVQTVQYNEATYAKISSLLDMTGSIKQDVLLTSLNNLQGKTYNLTSDGSVIVDSDQILIRNLTNVSNLLKIDSQGIRVSSDGGESWTTAITGRGVNIGAVYTGFLNTDEVIIGDANNPSFRWDKSGLSAFKKVDDSYSLNTYVRYDQFGLYGIKDGSTFKARTLQDVYNRAHFAITWDGFFIKNSYEGGGKVQITSDNDIQVINADQTEKIKIGALEWIVNNQVTTTPQNGIAPSLYGIRINNNEGETVFKTGDDGNLTITGTIYATDGELGSLTVTDIITIGSNGAIQSDNYSTEAHTGWNIDNSGATFNNAFIKGTIYATAGEIGGMSVDDNKLSMNHIVLEPGVGIYTDIPTVVDGEEEPSFLISDTTGNAIFNNTSVRGHIEAKTGDFTGWVAVGDRNQNAFTNPWIIISGGVTSAAQDAYGAKAIIKTSNYQDGVSSGWMINSDGNAFFNNITARGAIKTATFEYAEIQAVGGMFMFRPSSVIRTVQVAYNLSNDFALIDSNGDTITTSNSEKILGTTDVSSINTNKNYYELNSLTGEYDLITTFDLNEALDYYEGDLLVTVEKPLLFKVGEWCKISNYAIDSNGDYNDNPNPNINNILATNGLTHIYKISKISNIDNNITLILQGARALIDTLQNAGQTINEVLNGLIGGALIDVGNTAHGNGRVGNNNYGIGINSSDNTVNLPPRAISLFETRIDERNDVKVSYDYRGIFGTLPTLSENKVNNLYKNYLAGTQGIYTDNIYIGDKKNYIAFYTDDSGKHLRIAASDIIYQITDNDEEITWQDKLNEATEQNITVQIESSAGTIFKNSQIASTLTCTVKRGNTDITDKVVTFTWTKKNSNGTLDEDWIKITRKPQITITSEDIQSKAIFICEVNFNEEIEGE